jgi:hypothetical protein
VYATAFTRAQGTDPAIVRDGAVRPEERTVVSALTNLVRIATWAVAPLFAGAFQRIRPPEERGV